MYFTYIMALTCPFSILRLNRDVPYPGNLNPTLSRIIKSRVECTVKAFKNPLPKQIFSHKTIVLYMQNCAFHDQL